MIRFLLGLLLVVTIQIPDDQPLTALLVFIPLLGLMLWGIHDMKKKGII